MWQKAATPSEVFCFLCGSAPLGLAFARWQTQKHMQPDGCAQLARWRVRKFCNRWLRKQARWLVFIWDRRRADFREQRRCELRSRIGGSRCPVEGSTNDRDGQALHIPPPSKTTDLTPHLPAVGSFDKAYIPGCARFMFCWFGLIATHANHMCIPAQ